MVVFGVSDPSPISTSKMMFAVLLVIALRSILSFGGPVRPNCTMPDDVKWLQHNGSVIVKYTYHQTLKNDKVLRGLINKAADIFKQKTCVQWIETNMTDPCHKVVITYQKDICSTKWKHNEDKGYLISLDPKCYKIYILLHEMMHAVGIRHTQSRPDRNFYVNVWEDNIEPDKKGNFEIHRFIDTYGIPYDYESIMHYNRLDFTKNNLLTMTPTDTLALFSMGIRKDRLRWSDAATVNNHLDCIDNLPPTCPIEKRPHCENGGFVLHTCECSCPENTEGGVCEIKHDRPIYDKTVQCGAVIHEHKIISTLGIDFEREANIPCVFEIAPKQCHEAHIEFFKLKMPGKTCEDHVLAIEYPGNLRTFCYERAVPMDQEIPIPSSKAAVHFYLRKYFPGKASGFSAHVTFHENKTWPRGTEISQVTKDCYHSTSGPHFEFRTPYFPSTVACFAQCVGEFYHDMKGNILGTMRLELQHRLKESEQLVIEDRNFALLITHSSPESLTRVVQMPATVIFKGRDDPGKGFAIEMFQGGVGLCDGKILYVRKSGLEITNPIFNSTLSNCYLHIRASDGNKLFFKLMHIDGDILYTAIWDNGESKV